MAEGDTPPRDTAVVLGCSVSTLRRPGLLSALAHLTKSGKKSHVLYANVHTLNLAQRHTWLKQMFDHAGLVINDSDGLIYFGRWVKAGLVEKNTMAEFGKPFAEMCASEKFRVFFLGNRTEIAEAAAEKLTHEVRGFNVVGTHHGFFDKAGRENKDVVDLINQAQPDILVIGFGAPAQEKWIQDNREELDVPLVMAGGNCFGYWSGMEKRAPSWMLDAGLEWLYRFWLEPVRLANRYLIGNPLFALRILRQRLTGRGGRL